MKIKHQYITNPTISPESHVVAAAQQLVQALGGHIPAGNKTAEALTKACELFTKRASAKQQAARARAEQNILRSNSAAQKTTHLPRVALSQLPRVEAPSPRIAPEPQVDCCVSQQQEYCCIGVVEQIVVPNQVRPTQIVEFMTKERYHSTAPWPATDKQRTAARQPNYISQDKEDKVSPPWKRQTRSHTRGSIIQEAMLSCMDITQTKYTLSPHQMSMR